MNFKLVAALLLGSTVVAGCATQVEDGSASTQDELVTKLVGAFHGANPSSLPPSFEGIVFQDNGEFFADVDTGIRCITAPCPSHERLVGRYTATSSTLSLTPSGSVSVEGRELYGKYQYKLDGDTLSLTREGSEWKDWSGTLGKALSYCGEVTDCGGQKLIHPECVGEWSCTAARACVYDCSGHAPASIWPLDRKTLVAKSAGGGFVPPAPAGSTCALGAQKYELDVTTNSLSWETCQFVDLHTPLRAVRGAKKLTDAEITAVDRAMGEVSVSTRAICGADKPYLSLSVTTASTTKTYADSFYSCMADHSVVYIDNIDEVFEAFQQMTR